MMGQRSLVAASLLALVSLATPALAHPNHAAATPTLAPWQQASAWPDRIITTFETDPTTSFAVTWRTDARVTQAVAEIVRATPDARFDLGASSKAAYSEPLDLETIKTAGQELKMTWNAGLAPVTYQSINFDGLEPDTLYAYRVGGGDGKWSEWFQVRTAPKSGPIKFLYVGDAQNGVLSHWSRLI
ncbi:MAG: fibronectin type III domain-containing protein, partial [bacterium]